MDGGRNACIMHTLPQRQKEDLLKKELRSLINVQGWTPNLNWSDKKVKTNIFIDTVVLKYTVNSMCWTSVHCFFLTCQALKTWFELSRVTLYRNDLKGNKNYFELAGGSCNQGFKLLRVKLQ